MNPRTIASIPGSDIDAIREWAKTRPYVIRVWLYGSRVKGTNREESDLDVAVEHAAAPGDEDPFTTAISDKVLWQTEVQSVTKLNAHVESYIPGESERVATGLRDGGVIVYQRAT